MTHRWDKAALVCARARVNRDCAAAPCFLPSLLSSALSASLPSVPPLSAVADRSVTKVSVEINAEFNDCTEFGGEAVGALRWATHDY